ncbi:MAG: FAD-dependent oxidoreductase [Lentisphaeria bacterium]|nr:FAD-dependent oxidoreductase [Lentisphaeria bacterium]
MKTVREPARDLPVWREVDVVVAGSGPSGIGAALAAARSGARTLLVERYGYLGGMMTGAYVTAILGFHNGERQIVHGIGEEIVRRLDAEGGLLKWREKTPVDCVGDAEFMKWLFLEMLEEAGVEVLLHTWAVGTVMDGAICRGILTESKGGRRAILAGVTVDATADGDLCAASGCDMVDDTHDITMVHRFEGVDRARADAFAKENPERWQALLDEMAAVGGERPGGNTPYVQGRSAICVEDLTAVESEARKRALRGLVFARRKLPGYENAKLAWTAPQLGVRESRKIVAEYSVTEEDLRASRRFEDTVGRCGAHLDGYALYRVSGLEYDLPYRCLVPRDVDGILATGRCLGATHLAMNTLRLIVPCFLTGEAAGTAAALAVREQVQPRVLPVAALQARLRARNNNLG